MVMVSIWFGKSEPVKVLLTEVLIAPLIIAPIVKDVCVAVPKF